MVVTFVLLRGLEVRTNSFKKPGFLLILKARHRVARASYKHMLLAVSVVS